MMRLLHEQNWKVIIVAFIVILWRYILVVGGKNQVISQERDRNWKKLLCYYYYQKLSLTRSAISTPGVSANG